MRKQISVVVLVLCAAAAAQRTKTPKRERGGQQEFLEYSAVNSRGLFTACDRNRDDRISWFEAVESIVGIDRTRFGKFDANNDGRIQQDEFDRRFKELTSFGGRLTLSRKAVMRLPATVTNAAPLLVRFFTNLDSNRDERLGPEEWKPIEVALPKEVRVRFTQLDRNLSGNLSLSELEGLLDIVKQFEASQPKRPTGKQLRPLPAPLRAADLSADSLLDKHELTRALARIHPTLVKWSQLIMSRADSNGDRHLDANEIQAATITKPPTKPARKPPSRR